MTSSDNCAKTYDLVQSHYSDCAKTNSTASSDLNAYNTRVASAFGYSAEELATIPTDANLGVSCGNPLATVGLKQGEIVVDLGSGAGLDVFIAAKKVGTTGKAIGIDMTQDMLDLANRNAGKGGYTNVEFIKSYIHSIPLPASTVDVITSNCVINLVPDSQKPTVFTEIYRLLKPGGRMALSDILKHKKLPKDVQEDLGLYVGCISGASEVAEYRTWMTDAGFKDIMIVDTKKDINIYKEGTLGSEAEVCDPSTANDSGCCAPEKASVVSGGCCAATSATETLDTEEKKEKARKIRGYDFNHWVGAFQIYAIKPAED